MSSETGIRKALVVDGEAGSRELMEATLADLGVEVHGAGDLATARRLLAGERFDLCLAGSRLPDGDSLSLVHQIQRDHPDTPIAVVGRYPEAPVEALKAGAFDFLGKPVDRTALRNLARTALKLSEPIPDRRSRDILIGDSAPMRRIRSTILKLARSQAPVYISGESGTGKELVARLIHEKGPRAEGPFVPVNCGAIPADLIESELFGHRKGSFTGATADKLGLFRAADGGTLFLDEIADLPLAMQVKLVRAIQEKAVRPVGEAREVSVDVRILCATHQDLGELAREGRFREDLYYRINVIELALPSLRERREDIPQLAEHILDRLAVRLGQRLTLAPEALAELKGYAFPGNVRELENLLERAATLCEGECIEARELDLPLHDRVAEEGLSLESYLAQVEKDAILKALKRVRYNKTAAARLLGISFRALRYRLKKLDIE